MRIILSGLLLLCFIKVHSQPFADVVTDYGIPAPVMRNGAMAKAFLLNIGADIYKVQKDKPFSLLMGARVGILKNDGLYIRDATQQLWGTKLQAGFVAGIQATRIARGRALMAMIAAGPVHMANIEIGRLDQPMTAASTEAAAYAEVLRGVYFGAKYVYYPLFFDHKLHRLPFAMQSVVAVSMRVGI
jgi:hypothetical protein